MNDVMKLWNEWQSLMKNKSRQSDLSNRRADFVARLDSLFDIGAPRNAKGSNGRGSGVAT